MDSQSIAIKDDSSETAFMIRPALDQRIKRSTVKEIVHSILGEELSQFQYDPDKAEAKANNLAEIIREKLNELSIPRYKYVVNVVIGEQRGGGLKIVARCLWDTDTDSSACDTYLGDSFFCSASVYSIFFY